MAETKLPIEDAQRKLASKLMRRAGVAGVGIGSRGGAPCLKVYLSVPEDSVRGRIPGRFRGHPVVVSEGGEFRAQSGATGPK